MLKNVKDGIGHVRIKQLKAGKRKMSVWNQIVEDSKWTKSLYPYEIQLDKHNIRIIAPGSTGPGPTPLEFTLKCNEFHLEFEEKDAAKYNQFFNMIDRRVSTLYSNRKIDKFVYATIRQPTSQKDYSDPRGVREDLLAKLGDIEKDLGITFAKTDVPAFTDNVSFITRKGLFQVFLPFVEQPVVVKDALCFFNSVIKNEGE